MELGKLREILQTSALTPHKRKRVKNEILNLVCAFDIETSNIAIDEEIHAFMYIWQCSINNELVLTGRTWEEYKEVVDVINEECARIKQEKRLKEKPLVVMYVHNLAFEFQFLSGIFEFKPEDVFLRSARKPIYARTGCIEYRCSYIHSNMSLARFCESMGIEDKKLSGQEFDYQKIRYPWTEMGDKEIAYCVRDVVCLVDCIKKEMFNDGDNLITIPLTSTGYVRRECYNALAPVMKKIKSILPGVGEYKLLRKAFRGGNTHANRYYVGKVLEGIESDDMASAYPSVLVNEKYPYKFKMIEATVENIHKFICYGCAVVFTAIFKNFTLKKDREPMPYISLAKTKSTGGEKCGEGYIDLITDNGRVLSAGLCEMTITEVDYEIIRKQYKWDNMVIVEAMFAEKDYLPTQLIDVIMEYYNKKTKLKGLEDEENQYFYMKSKNKLNSIYGMCATNPLQDTIEYIDNDYRVKIVSEEEKADLLQKAKFPYQWGVYCTAYARRALQEGIDKCGDKVVYCDTDSVKHFKGVDLTKINNARIKKDMKRGAFAVDRKDNRHYLGVYEHDGFYDQFITQGAKRYAYVADGKLKVTVSGVTKNKNEKTGKPFASEELDRIENFKPGMIWRAAGGTRSIYNDEIDKYIDVDGQKLHITKNVAIVPTTYELSYSNDYERLLTRISLYGRWKKDGMQ